MKSALPVMVLLVLSLPTQAADVVIPIDAVEFSVNIRMEADAKSEIVGKLVQGESIPYQRTVSGWHEVRLLDDAYGYISADWSRVVADAEIAAEGQTADEEIAVAAVEDEGDTEMQAESAQDVSGVSPEAASEEGLQDATQELQAADESSEASESAIDETQNFVLENEAADDVVAETSADEDFAESESSAETVVVPIAVASQSDTAGPMGPAGPEGPIGPMGPPGPGGTGTIEGTVDYLMKFTASTIAGNSQVFDNGRNVGIGTSEPKQRLEVNGNIQIHEQNSNVAGLLLTQASGEIGYIMHNRANTLTLGAGSVDRLTIDGEGNVGIGTAKPSHPIEMASGAYVSAGGVWTNSSSRDRKENIVELTPEEALAALADLEPVRFNYKTDDTEEYVGFIAEDVPALVSTADRASLSTMDIVAVLTRVVQQQQQKIAELEARLDREGR